MDAEATTLHWVLRDQEGRLLGFYKTGLHQVIPEGAEPLSAAEYEAMLETGAYQAPPQPLPIEVITARQCRQELLARGLLEDVEAAVAAAGQAVAIDWEYATVIERYSPLVLQVAEGLDWSAELLDDLFSAASAR